MPLHTRPVVGVAAAAAALARRTRPSKSPAASVLRSVPLPPLAALASHAASAASAASVAFSRRYSSHSPMGPAAGAAPARKKVTIPALRALYARGEPIAVLTAHDFPSAHVADAAGVDILLVGDSLAMVAMGMEDTSEVVVEEMLHHCRSVARARPAAFLVGDLPMGSYELGPQQALATAIRFVKEGRVQGVKLEGGGAAMAPTIRAIARDAGIPVLAHIGLTPQRHNSLGGFRVQGRTAAAAHAVLADARAVQAAGAFAVVLEAVPADVARVVTAALSIPTIGIGAGSACSGQVLVQVDMTGNFPPGRFLPKFVRRYGDVWGEAHRAVTAYCADVKARAYPAPEHTYAMPAAELQQFLREVEAATSEDDGGAKP